jgi:hypothetical protein
MPRAIRFIVTVLLLGAMAQAGGTTRAAAQNGNGEGFPLPTNTAYCEPGYLGPFVGCTPWEGVTVTYTSADGTFSQSCTTAATWDRSASCEMSVPFGSSITASIDPAVVPAGYVLQQPASQTFDIPSGPPEGEFGGPVFVLFADVTPTEAPTAVPTEAPTEPPTAEPALPVTETTPATGQVVELPGTGTGQGGATGSGGTLLAALGFLALIAGVGVGYVRRRSH